jgi:hypothetical protein
MVGEDSKSKKGEDFLLSNVSAEGEPLDPARIALSGLRSELAQFRRLGIVPAEFKPNFGASSQAAASEPRARTSQAEKDLSIAKQALCQHTDPMAALKNAEEHFKLAIKQADTSYQVQKAGFSQEQNQLESELKAAQNENSTAFKEFEAALGKVPDNQALKMFHFVQAFISMPLNDPDAKITAALLDRHGLLKVSQGLAKANANSCRVNEKIADLKVRAGEAQLDRIRTREAYIDALKHAGQIALAIKLMSEIPDIWTDAIFKDLPSAPDQRETVSSKPSSTSQAAKAGDRRKPRGTPV